MNRSVKRLVSVLLAILVLSALTGSALAVENTDMYTVTVSVGNVAGAQLIGQNSWTEKAGTWVNFGMVTLPATSPYYFKGFRPAGKDNNVVYSSSIPVTEDADYVAAYGLQGELVKYTVYYLLAGTNTELRPSQEYYGNVGDKSVVAYLNIDGYQPQALNLAKTLVEDEDQNVFRFEYSEIIVPTPEPVVQPTPYVYTEGAETAPAPEEAEVGGEPVPAGGGEAAPEVQEAAPEEPEQPEEPAQEEINEDDTPLNDTPQEYIDLDKTALGETPELKEKPKTEIQQERADKETKLYVALGLLGVSLVVIAALVAALVRKRSAKS